MESAQQNNDKSDTSEKPPDQTERPPVKGNEYNIRSNYTQDASKEVKTFHEPKHWTQYAEAFAALALVVITASYTHYAGKQVDAMGQQLQQMRTASDQAKIDNTTSITAQQKIAQDALIASQKSVDKSLGATIDNFHLDQRAWIGIVGVSIDAVEIDKPLYTHVVMFNSGKTIAKHVTAAFHLRFSPTEFKKVPPPSGNEPETKSVGILVPSSRYDSKFTDPN